MSDTRDPDEPLSSDDLLRRARDGLSFGTSDDVAEAPIDPAIAEEPGAEAEPTPPAAPQPLTNEELEARWTPEPVAPADPSWDPDWTPGPAQPTTGPGHGGPVVGSPDPSVLPPRPQGRSFFARNALWIIGLVVVGGIFVFNSFDRTANVNALEAGDCILDTGLEDVIETVETIDCGDPHEFEVISVVELGGTLGSSLAAYPGEDVLYDAALNECIGTFLGYVGIDYAGSELWVEPLYPVEQGWDQGDRSATCIAFAVDTSTGDVKPLTSSVRDSRR